MRKLHANLLFSGVLIVGLLTVCASATVAAVGSGKVPERKFANRSESSQLLDTTPAPPLKPQLVPSSVLPERARPVLPPRHPLGEMQVSLDIVVAGRTLSTIQYAGRTYLPVPEVGAEYQIRVWNHGPRRITAIVSVDGLSVITGKPASEAGPGYIVAPHNSVLIEGWRRDLDRVAAFRFVPRDKSYADLMGRPEDVGVIGLVAFEELVRVPHPMLQEKDTAAPRKALSGLGSIGTEYGRTIDSQVYLVPFVRSANKQTVTLYYDTVEALHRMGVPVDRPWPVPFPGDSRFAPPPPGSGEK